MNYYKKFLVKYMLRSRRGMDNQEMTESMLKVWFVYYNFLRPHSALNGKTPAEASGIELDLENSWESLIYMATKYKNQTGETITSFNNLAEATC